MSIATKTGDRGDTSLVGGRRVSKADLRVEAYGTIDELIAGLGLARGLCIHEEAGQLVKAIQRELFAVAEAIAGDAEPLKGIEPARIDAITAHIHRIEAEDGIMSDWAVPGDHAGAAALDVARTVCRRAERDAVRLIAAGEPLHPSVVIYLNRLADLLWLLGRMVERDAGVDSALRQPGQGGTRWSKAW